MSEELTISRPEDVQRQSRVVALPIQQNGRTIVLRLGAVRTETVLEAFDGIPGAVAPGAGPERTFAQAREALAKGVNPTRLLAAEGIMEPPFSFEQREDGKAFWDDLVEENKAAVVRELMELSGWKADKSAAGATFREGAGQ